MDLLTKIKSGASEVSRQAQTMIEINRMKAQVSEKQSAIESKFQDIGQRIYTLVRSTDNLDVDQEIAGLCDQVNIMEEEIKEINNKIIEIKGIKNCPQCSHQVPFNTKFCPNCGTNVENMFGNDAPEEINTKKCTQCQKIVKADVKFCTGCGSPLQ